MGGSETTGIRKRVFESVGNRDSKILLFHKKNNGTKFAIVWLLRQDAFESSEEKVKFILGIQIRKRSK